MFNPIVRIAFTTLCAFVVASTVYNHGVFGCVVRSVSSIVFVSAFCGLVGGPLLDMTMVNTFASVVTTCVNVGLGITNAWRCVFTRHQHQRAMQNAAAKGEVPLSVYEDLAPDLDEDSEDSDDSDDSDGLKDSEASEASKDS